MGFWTWFTNFFHLSDEPVDEPADENKEETKENNLIEEEIKPMPEPVAYKKRKRALLVGIDKYATPGSDLNGCVNDVWDMYDLLVKTYGFDPDDVRVVVDERATFYNVEKRLEWLIANTKAGDEAVFYQSSHGSQVRDRNKDELSDGMDECLIVHDHDWDNPFIDDLLHEIFAPLNPEAFLTVIVDTCHSGTMTRGFKASAADDPSGKAYQKERFLTPPFDIMARSLHRRLKLRKFAVKSGAENEQRHILLSGCREDQTSKELRFGGEIRGAMTFNFARLLRAAPDQTWTQVHSSVHRAVKNLQDPVLRGTEVLKNRLVFGGEVV